MNEGLVSLQHACSRIVELYNSATGLQKKCIQVTLSQAFRVPIGEVKQALRVANND